MVLLLLPFLCTSNALFPSDVAIKDTTFENRPFADNLTFLWTMRDAVCVTGLIVRGSFNIVGLAICPRAPCFLALLA